MQNPFLPSFEHLPSTLPIFPLQDALVMPGAQLPLNIFEPRYLKMVQNSLATHHLIGMVQPASILKDETEDKDKVYSTGGAGRITFYNETDDGRIEIMLTGVCRFDIKQELPSRHGYRLVEPDWHRFAADYEFSELDESSNKPAFFATLDNYLQANNLEMNQDVLKQLPFAQVLNVLTTLLPLHHSDKQAIIETVTFSERFLLLSSTIEMMSSAGQSHLRH
ncbi:MAG: LON peptidase substrate-binding domain-containing protein [Candidatus Thiodiazotropha sp. (ex Semelilucina semeliformis)]|nr:LON peptidase substrate-binding domain-containing protein [Candidatus Thiodiazotropha sp. (ex Semelilucina semeliformis)]